MRAAAAAALALALAACAPPSGGDPATGDPGETGGGGAGGAPAPPPGSPFEPPAGAQLLYPARLAVAEDGTIFASDPGSDHVFAWRDGRRVLSLGGLRRPLGLAVHGDRLFVGEAGRQAVRVFDWRRQSFAGALGAGDGEVELPTAIAVAPDGTIHVADAGADLVRSYDPSLAPIGQLGGRGTEPGRLRFPSALAVDGTRVAVADQGNHRIQLFDRSGTLLAVLGEPLPADTASRDGLLGRFTRLQGLAFSGGRLYALDSTHVHLQVTDLAGAWLPILPLAGVALPLDLAAGPDGTLLVSDPEHRRWVTVPAPEAP